MSKCSRYTPLVPKNRTIMLKSKDKGALGDPNPIELILYEDGNVAFSMAEQFTYLYKDQVKKLLKILEKEEALYYKLKTEVQRG